MAGSSLYAFATRDDNAYTLVSYLLAEQLGDGGDVLGQRGDHVQVSGVHAEAEADGLILVGAGRVLAACHASGKIVANDYGDTAVLIDGVQQSCHAAVGEGGVTYHGNGGAQSGIGGTLGHGDARSHIHAAGQSLERRQRTQRVAADVAKHAGIGIFVNYFAQRTIYIPVAAALT